MRWIVCYFIRLEFLFYGNICQFPFGFLPLINIEYGSSLFIHYKNGRTNSKALVTCRLEAKIPVAYAPAMSNFERAEIRNNYNMRKSQCHFGGKGKTLKVRVCGACCSCSSRTIAYFMIITVFKCAIDGWYLDVVRYTRHTYASLFYTTKLTPANSYPLQFAHALLSKTNVRRIHT